MPSMVEAFVRDAHAESTIGSARKGQTLLPADTRLRIGNERSTTFPFVL